MNEPKDFALVPRLPTAVVKSEPGAKRVLSGMVTDTLALAKKKPSPKTVLSVLLRGFSGNRWPDIIEAIIESQWGNQYAVKVTDESVGPTILLELGKQYPFDVFIVKVDKLPPHFHDLDDFALKPVITCLFQTRNVEGSCSDAWLQRENKEPIFFRYRTWVETLLSWLSAKKAKYPIFVISGSAKPEELLQCLDPNLSVSFMRKPVPIDEFYWQLIKRVGLNDHV